MLRRRIAARVLLTGRSRLAAPVAVALVAAGVGHLQVEVGGHITAEGLAGGPLSMQDVGRPAAEAVMDAVRRIAPHTRPVPRGTAGLVVQFAPDEPTTLVAAAHSHRRQPYLSVHVEAGVPVIGPLVVPGRPPCLGCLDLHRRDRDPGRAPDGPSHTGPEPLAVTTVLAATAYVTAECLTHLDGGRPETLAATVEISTPRRVRRRSWSPHPSCRCRHRR